jgi:hypothetical protein
VNSLVLIAACFLACAHSQGQPEDACAGMARAFHALGSSKDLGLSLEEQLGLVRALARESKDPVPPEANLYLEGMLAIIYSHPELDAEAIRSRVLEVCTTDAEGRISLPPDWDPWRHGPNKPLDLPSAALADSVPSG